MFCIKPTPLFQREQLQVVHLHLAASTEQPDLHRKRKTLCAIGNSSNQRGLSTSAGAGDYPSGSMAGRKER